MQLTRKLLFIYALVFCFTALPADAWAAAPASEDIKVLRIAVEAPYPPFAMLDEDGNLSGFDVDIAYALCNELGYECDVQNVPFDEILPRIVAGEIDLGIAGMGASAERKQLVDFTERYFRSLSIFIEKEGTLSELTPETIKGLRVGTQEGTLQAEYLQKTYGSDIILFTVPSYELVFELLKLDEIDLALVDGLPGYTYLKSEDGIGLETIGDAIESGGVMDWASIAVSKEKPWLREAVNQAIQTLRRNGEYGKINRKYFDFNIY